MGNSCFIDAHCHLDDYENIEEIINNAIKADVKIMIAQGTDFDSNRKVLELASEYPEIKAALGLYPISALKLTDSKIEEELHFIKKNKEKVFAIGEVGIDFKEDTDNHQRQIEIFEKIILLSKEIDKTLIIHSRKAEKEVIELLKKHEVKKVIMHCFSGNFKLVKEISDKGWFLTIPTSVKNSEHFQKIIKEIDISKLLCETDSPYLHPDKEWPNEPANVIESYKKIAEIKGISLEEVKDKIFENYKLIFQ